MNKTNIMTIDKLIKKLTMKKRLKKKGISSPSELACQICNPIVIPGVTSFKEN
jgi:hypothetical protein